METEKARNGGCQLEQCEGIEAQSGGVKPRGGIDPRQFFGLQAAHTAEEIGDDRRGVGTREVARKAHKSGDSDTRLMMTQ